ncbi:MAG TPA: MFS transporter, partial [Methylomirabilota bacterium]|nr:MFS transporter [Methylomirabilota bacterium]
MKREDKTLGLACLLTLLHYTGAYMRVPVLPLYANAHGATPTDVGLIMGASMVVAALSAIPFGTASDRWGRRGLLLGGTAV